jgi:hypothetical protein
MLRMFAVLALALVGCGPVVGIESLNAPVRPMAPREPEHVELLTQKPARPFVEVAMIRIRESKYDATAGTLFEKIRARGAKMGCEAVVIVGRDDDTELFDRHEPVVGYMASCIQYRDDRALLARKR